VLFYSIALIQFIVGLFNDFIIGDAYDQEDTVSLEEDVDNINILGEGAND
jgi:hypothetical protein